MRNIEISDGMGPNTDTYYSDLSTHKTNVPKDFEPYIELSERTDEFNKSARQALINLAVFEDTLDDPDIEPDLDMHDKLVRRHERTRNTIFWIASIAAVMQDPEAILAIIKVKEELTDLHSEDGVISLGTTPFPKPTHSNESDS